MRTFPSKTCDPRFGQAEYERCLEDRRLRRSGKLFDSRLSDALAAIDRDTDGQEIDIDE